MFVGFTSTSFGTSGLGVAAFVCEGAVLGMIAGALGTAGFAAAFVVLALERFKDALGLATAEPFGGGRC